MQHGLLTQIRAVIFDMDGLMLDTEPLYKIAWQRASAECGHPISEELYARLIGRTRIACEETLRDEFGTSFSIDRFRDSCARCEAAAFAETLPSMKPGLERLLDLLEACRIPDGGRNIDGTLDCPDAPGPARFVGEIQRRYDRRRSGKREACIGYISAGSGEIGRGA